ILDGFHADQGVVLVEIDEHHAFARTRQIVHFLHRAAQRAAFAGGIDHDFFAAHDRYADHGHAFGDLGVTPTRARARLQERRDANAEPVAVAGARAHGTTLQIAL